MPHDHAKTSLAEHLLLLFCRKHEVTVGMVHYAPASEMDTLNSLFPDLTQRIAGKRVIDFGCGHGYQCVALAQSGAAHVTGVEIQEHLVHQAKARVTEAGLQDRIQITTELGHERADVLISQNSFEHFTAPVEILAEIERALEPGGIIFLTFGPLWYSPRGSHMEYFCSLPWVNLFFSEQTIMAVRSRFRSDGKRTYEQAGLGRMSLRRFEQVTRDAGLKLEWKRYDTVSRIPVVNRVPLLRELFVNRVSCILSVPPRTLANG